MDAEGNRIASQSGRIAQDRHDAKPRSRGAGAVDLLVRCEEPHRQHTVCGPKLPRIVIARHTISFLSGSREHCRRRSDRVPPSFVRCVECLGVCVRACRSKTGMARVVIPLPRPSGSCMRHARCAPVLGAASECRESSRPRRDAGGVWEGHWAGAMSADAWWCNMETVEGEDSWRRCERGSRRNASIVDVFSQMCQWRNILHTERVADGVYCSRIGPWRAKSLPKRNAVVAVELCRTWQKLLYNSVLQRSIGISPG